MNKPYIGSNATEPELEANKSGIIKALKNFTDLDNNKIDALYALRNSFAHDFSLTSVGRRAGLTHQFIVDNSSNKPLLVLPLVPWSGDITDNNDSIKTYVNLQAFGDLVEGLIDYLKELNNECNIEIILDDGVEELIAKYSFFTG